MQETLLKHFYEPFEKSFEVWQVAVDKVWESWMMEPAALQMVKKSLDTLLDLKASYNQLSALFGMPLADEILRNMSETTSRYIRNSFDTVSEVVGKELIPKLAPTAYDLVYAQDNMKLLRYKSGKRTYKTPILLVCSLVNRYYILDLARKHSYVQYLLDNGFDVYIIDWGRPDNRNLDFTDYVDRYIGSAVKEIKKLSNVNQITIFGYCIGGIFSTIYTAKNPEEVKNLILMATPIDFSKSGLIGYWADENYFDVDRLIDLFGYAPAELVQNSFVMLKPITNFTKYIYMFKHPSDEEYLRGFLALEIWVHDNVPIAGAFYKKLIKDLYRKNLLIKGGFKVGTEKVDLGRIASSLLVLTASHDNIVPESSSLAIMDKVSSIDKENTSFPYGHISMSVSSGAMQTLWPHSVNWLKQRSTEKES